MQLIEKDRSQWQRAQRSRKWVWGALVFLVIVTLFGIYSDLSVVVKFWSVAAPELKSSAFSGKIDGEKYYSGYEIIFIRAVSRVEAGCARLLIILLAGGTLSFLHRREGRIWSYVAALEAKEN